MGLYKFYYYYYYHYHYYYSDRNKNAQFFETWCILVYFTFTSCTCTFYVLLQHKK